MLCLLLGNALVRRFTHKEQCAEQVCECREQVYYIEGLRCNHCRTNAEKAIAQLEGVDSAEVDLPTGRATVCGSVSAEQVRGAVEALGFNLKEN